MVLRILCNFCAARCLIAREGGEGGAGRGCRSSSIDPRTKRVTVEADAGFSRPVRDCEKDEGVQEVVAEGDEGGADVPRSRVPPPSQDVEYMRVWNRHATRRGDLRVVLVAGRQSMLHHCRRLPPNPSGERVR